ncbi:DNA/RNA non-specific endonuclease [Jiella pelagia]|uniref:Serine protease n=1 Tax=Jiella pelagia TaxID=2986949 RepID=A0ABY7BX84_9HYPH|nr:DNA/RNA non-specific endonuclease [Jiella pelagia]WAP67710.1 DNA/RNA non-specific endonuclease [Jiella pelagia]
MRLDLRWQEMPGQIFTLEPDRLFYADETLDFAVVAVATVSSGGIPLSGFGYLPLVGETGKIRIGQSVNIVQHPAGERKQVVFRESNLSNLPKTPDTIAQYTGDTKRGSSGSPVFSDRWEVIALHHAGVPDVDGSGNWLTVDGSVWNRAADPDMLTVKWVANEGIRISRIVAHLRSVAEANMASGSEHADLLASVLDVGARAAEDGLFPATPPISATPANPANATPVSESQGYAATGPSIAHGMRGPNPAPRDPGLDRLALSTPSVGALASIHVGEGNRLKVPLTISLSFGAPEGGGSAAASDQASERRRPEEYAERRGFDRNFLCQPVDMPVPQNTIAADVAAMTGSSDIELKYDHFSVLMSKSRRLAYVSAGNYDRDAPFHAPRRAPWCFDPRLAEDLQAGDVFYADNDLDRGHLFRRADGGWGMSDAEARRASADTFHWTNIAPQHFVFNQGNRDTLLSLWGQLETHLSEEVNANDGRMSVMNGPIFQRADPLHRGLAVPQAFFKIAVICGPDRHLRAYAFVVGQESLLGNLPREALNVGRFAVFQIKLRDLETRTGLDFGSLRLADVLERPGAESRFERSGAVIAIKTWGDIVGTR